MDYWNGKVAVVTGGASGIGAAVVEEFNGLGVNVGLMDLNAERAHEVAAVCSGPGAVSVCEGDVSNRSAAVHCAETCVRAWGRIDFLVYRFTKTITSLILLRARRNSSSGGRRVPH